MKKGPDLTIESVVFLSYWYTKVFFSFEPRFLREIDKTKSGKSIHVLFRYGCPLLDAFKINAESLIVFWVLIKIVRATVCAGMVMEVLGSGFLFSHKLNPDLMI